jgi:CBS domain-containing protein
MDTVRNVIEAKGFQVHTTAKMSMVLDAVDEMCRLHIGALLVVDRGSPVGILSERDLLTRVLMKRRDPAKTPVADVMTTGIVCVELDCSVEEAMRVMTERRCRHLPVVVDRKLVGLVSIGDVVRWVSRDHEYEIRMLHEYVEGRYPG